MKYSRDMPAINNGNKSGKPMSKKPAVQDSTVKIDLNVLEEADSKNVSEKLAKVLKSSYAKKPKIDWHGVRKEKLSKLKQRERIKQLRKEKTDQQISENSININHQKFISLGFNKVIKNIQERLCQSVIVSSSFPDKCMQILVDLCKLRSVNIIGIPKLEAVTKECLGFPCSVIAVAISPENENITELVETVSGFQQDNKADENQGNVESGSTSNKIVKAMKFKESETTKMPSPRNVHLKRKSNSERVFLPPNSDQEPRKKRLKVDDKSKTSSISNYQLTKL